MGSGNTLIGLATALGAGLLVGVERERRKGRGPKRAIAGVRTFALAAVAGAAARVTEQPLLVAAGAALLVTLAAIGHSRDRSSDPGITTEVALFLTYLLGVVAIGRPELAAGSAVIITIILASRGSLHRFAVDTLTESELRDGLLFCGAALVILPLLPEGLDPWVPALNPRRLWGLVVLFMGVQAAGYVALRAAGPQFGLALSGLASGLVSSTATIAALGARARRDPSVRDACVSGALFSTVATVLLLGVVAAAVNVQGLRQLGPSLLAGLLAALAVATANLWRRPGAVALEATGGRAFNLWHAAGFAVLLSVVTTITALVAKFYGQPSVALSTAFAGFFDVHAAATSVLSLGATGLLSGPGVTTSVLVAVTTNTISKVVAALSIGGWRYGLRVCAGLALVVAAMWAPLLWR
jgi:uncharacterized membrane protein (DUF4010 family)